MTGPDDNSRDHGEGHGDGPGGAPGPPPGDPRAGYGGLPNTPNTPPPPPPSAPPPSAPPPAAPPPSAPPPGPQFGPPPAAAPGSPYGAPAGGPFANPYASQNPYGGPYGPPPPTTPHGIGPVMYGDGSAPQFPPAPPTVRPPRDQRLAVTAALLNLSGLGAGYLYLRRWWQVVPSLLLTGLLLWAVLPVTADGISGQWVALYVLGLLVLAADAWRLARPETPRRRPLLVPLTTGILLLAIPAGAVVFFEDAQRQALEDDLQERLALADDLVEQAGDEPFEEAEQRYRSALDGYVAVRSDHPDTDAAAEVPDRLDALYEQATTPAADADDPCGPLTPLRFFRDLPGENGEGPDIERLSVRAADTLPEPLHACGLSRTAQGDVEGAREPFTELLGDHADSPLATGLPEELGVLQGTAADGVEGDQPCDALDQLRDWNELFGELPGEQFAQLAADGQGPVPDGLFACGTAQFRAGDFTDSEATLRDLLAEDPDHPEADYTQDILIAAQIAARLPAAGESLPPRPGAGGGGPTITVEVSNDSPNELELLWTGTRTGSRTVGACGSCDVYTSDPGDAGCSADIDYPTTTLELPAGEYHFLHRAPDLDVDNLAETTEFEANYEYTWCTFTIEGLQLPAPDGTDA
ncbi:DUF3488 domain-containing protein [Streptomyces avicenniae]|uniref:DUF3488 domain-containing protein n=1 Tax=Streptomyces avicenniae TaxID=500153 RepID=UPI000699F07D|nr:DUF3488 domain-containing protein [Streptomyces avicenniae]